MIVLDTHAWLWWVADPGRLSQAARHAIDRAAEIGIAAISCWEVATLVARGRIKLDRDIDQWTAQALALPRMREVPVDRRIAVTAGRLDTDRFVGDPADRIIYATARTGGSPLVTRDARLRAFDPNGTVW